MAAKEIEVSTQPNIKVNLENDEATHYTCTEEKKQQNGHWSTAATPRPFLVNCMFSLEMMVLYSTYSKM